jgi:hypothetical protein
MPNPIKQNLYSKYKYIWDQLDNNLDSLFVFIQEYPYIRMDDYGNITVKNTVEDKPLPVFCCHLDTVHKEEPQIECIYNSVLISQGGGGVGGDDKCGIVACLELLEKVPCKCIFFRDEESGCTGSKQFDAESLKNDLFCIEIDRRGGSDLIFSGSRGCMCNDEFKDRIKKHFLHGKAVQGSLTDVCVLGEAEINMMNLSAGYYKPHSDQEYVILPELERNIGCLVSFTNDVLDNPLKDKNYKRKEEHYSYGNYRHYSQGTWHRAGEDLFPGNESDAGEDDYNACQYGNYGKKEDKA